MKDKPSNERITNAKSICGFNNEDFWTDEPKISMNAIIECIKSSYKRWTENFTVSMFDYEFKERKYDSECISFAVIVKSKFGNFKSQDIHLYFQKNYIYGQGPNNTGYYYLRQPEAGENFEWVYRLWLNHTPIINDLVEEVEE